ncbi:LOW QUALITY PROTEIN: hypothetical protein YC2023_031738 [Brassica napus]
MSGGGPPWGSRREMSNILPSSPEFLMSPPVHGTSRHCRWSVFRLLELSRDVESVRKLVGLDPTRHFTVETERERAFTLLSASEERERVVARVGVSGSEGGEARRRRKDVK